MGVSPNHACNMAAAKHHQRPVLYRFKAGARGGGNRFRATMWTFAFRWTQLDAFGDHVFFGKSALDFRGVVWLHLAGL